MRILRSTVVIPSVAILLLGADVLAHDPPEGSTVFSAPVPNLSLGGGITFATLIGPSVGRTIVHSELDLTFRPRGSTTAQEVELTFSIVVDGVSKHWTVTGSDLGWGTGRGTFRGTIDSDELFGQVDASGLGGTSIMNLTMRSVTGAGLEGRFTNSALNLTLSDALSYDNVSVSASAGGVQNLTLKAGANHAGETYLVMGSWSGTVPGIPVGAFVLPLNLDPYLVFTASNPNTLILHSLGALDAGGGASAQFKLPAGLAPFLAGLESHHAYVLVDSAGQITFASNPSTLRFTK